MNPSTLRYGTADGCTTVRHDDDDLALKLKQAATKLNLRTHFVKGKVRGFSGLRIKRGGSRGVCGSMVSGQYLGEGTSARRRKECRQEMR